MAGAADPTLYFGHVLLRLAGKLYKERDRASGYQFGAYQFGEVVVEGATLRYISLKSEKSETTSSGGNIERLELTGRV